MYASVSEVSMKMMAAPVVSFDINVLPPEAPKTDWLPPAPKDAPISAPFPDWSKTIPISAMLTVTCRKTKNAVMITSSKKFTNCNI